jgi:acyl-CoA thioester hydrolase
MERMEVTMVTMDGYPVVARFPMHWGEMDALGHVNNARYFTWFESSRIVCFVRMGFGPGAAFGVGPILKATSCEYLRPIAYPAEIVVGARVARIGTTSFEMEHAAALAASPNDPCARARAVLVLFDYAAQQKVPIPEDLRAALLGLQQSGG